MTESENLRLLAGLTQRPSAVEWFRGLFTRGHVEMSDTGERFTVLHHGDHVEVEPEFRGENPNFVIRLDSQNIRNLATFFEDDRIDDFEEYRIVKFMLQPCLEAGLAMPILRSSAFRRVVKIETHWQEALLDPSGNEDERFTVVFVNDQWLVIPGYHGRPRRRLVMKPVQVLEYQRRVFQANERNTLAAWLDVGRWYLQWRDDVSVPV
jgi:hypothetical protein